MTSKPFINAGVYNVPSHFFRCCKTQLHTGKVEVCKVAKSHQGIVETRMLFYMIFCAFPEKALKRHHKRQCLSCFRNCFLIFPEVQFPHWKSNPFRCREMASGLTEKHNSFCIILSPLPKRHGKVFINDSVYNVFAIGDSDVGQCMFSNSFLGILEAHLPSK